MAGPKFLIIDGCPCPALIAPYIKILLDDAGQDANSIYRGEDAKALLHAHGKHTQAEVYATSPAGVANPPGRSTHELRSDGHAYGGPVGRHLQDWQVGIDSGANTTRDRDAIQRAAKARRWDVFHPYATGVEMHHWNFRKRPRPMGPRTLAKVIRVRRQLAKA